MTDKELEKIFKVKKQRIVKKTGKVIAGFDHATVDDFKKWFSLEEFKKGCHYCGTTNEKSFELYQLQRKKNSPRYDGTRGGKRGRRLELDRKDPSKQYDDLENVVWCCHWCNNAKSNFFTAEEFMPIAAAIGKVIRSIENK